MQFKKRDDAKPRNRDEHRDLKNDGNPAGDLNPADIQVPKETERERSPSPLPFAGKTGNVIVEIIHQQHAVYRIQQKCSRPVPPAALKAPEIAESRAYPAVEPALHRQDAVHFGGRK